VSNRQPSEHQQAILNAFATLEPGGAIQINAVAGSGKTTTLLQLLELIPSDAHKSTLFCSFNTKIVNELAKRLPAGVQARSINALGLRTLRDHFAPTDNQWSKTVTKDSRYKDLFKLYAVQHLPELNGDDRFKFQRTVLEWLKFVRLSLTNDASAQALDHVAESYGVEGINDDNREDLHRALRELLKWGQHGAPSSLDDEQKLHPKNQIDFIDQLWLPHALKLTPHQYDYLLVDEAQDMSVAQQELVLSATSASGRLVAVGDECQAIYGFAGADFESFRRIATRSQAQQFPLSVSYRCARAIVQLASHVVPAISPAPDATPGLVRRISEVEAFEAYSPQDLVLCRTNAPLFDVAFKLMALNRPFVMLGKDITPQLLEVVRAVAKMGPWERFEDGLDVWQALRVREIELCSQSKTQQQAELIRLEDQIACVRLAYLGQGEKAASSEALQIHIKTLIKDPDAKDTDIEAGRERIKLASIHAAKGLEAERVFILKPHLLPHPMATSSSAIRQEENMKYVAITRAKLKLYVVEEQDQKVKWSGLRE
jgi:DNA helicase II / ATP-dependent DNA helicase PcrA